jgi:hypothetical protein
MTERANWISLSQVHSQLSERLGSQATGEVLLLEALRSGKIAIVADYYMGSNPHPDRMLRADNFRDAQSVIWKESRVEHRVGRSSLGPKGQTYYHMGDFHSVKLSISDVAAIWSDFQAPENLPTIPSTALSLQPPRKGLGGKKGDYDWDKYLIEASAYIYLNGLPETKEKLYEYLWSLFGGKKGGPSVASMKMRIGPLYDRLKEVNDN